MMVCFHIYIIYIVNYIVYKYLIINGIFFKRFRKKWVRALSSEENMIKFIYNYMKIN